MSPTFGAAAAKHHRARPSSMVLLWLVLSTFFTYTWAFSVRPVPSIESLFPSQKETIQPKTAPAQAGVAIEMPNFDELFKRIQEVSPLARQVMQKGNEKRGLEFIDDTPPPGLKWKRVETHKRGLIHSIEKIDHYMHLGPPLLRFRGTIKGPCVGEVFAKFITDLQYRKQWDSQIADTYERFLVHDLETVNTAQKQSGIGDSDTCTYGECVRFGVGYCKTKKNLGISPREQLTLCGIQDFDGSTMIWGAEMEEWHNHLLPEGTRVPRAKSHLFCTTLVPTSGESFDVEYLLQMDVGGIPNWLTTPLLIDSVKHLFKFAEHYYGPDGGIQEYLLEKAKHDDSLLSKDSHSILMPQ